MYLDSSSAVVNVHVDCRKSGNAAAPIEGQQQPMQPLLGYFLQELLLDEEKQISVGQCIVQAAKSQAVIPPLLLGLGVELDLKFRSKWLIDHLNNLGFSVTYGEVRRYKQSVLVANQESPVLPTYPDSFTQWVADNIWTTTQLLWMVLAHSTAWALLQHQLGPHHLLLHSFVKRL